jgi:PAS domain S-box-containing protein
MPDTIFRELADNAPVMIWRSGVDKLCDWFNKPWLDFVGRTMEQEQGYGWADGVHVDDFDRCVDIYTKAFDAREDFSMTYRLRRHDGVFRWVLDNGSPFQRNGKFAGYFGSCIDVTEQREAHDRLLATIAQRDALISEVYHRVKNNLQQIEGLIAIESLALADGASLTALQSVSSRVRAMGAVHQMLIKSKSIANIRADAFLNELCADIARAHAADRRGIAIEVEAEPRDLDIDRALIIGLLVNELATNAVKHAFPEGRSGRVCVRFSGAGAGAALEVADDGVGIPEGAIDPASNGRLEVKRGPGASIRIVLP